MSDETPTLSIEAREAALAKREAELDAREVGPPSASLLRRC